MGSDEGGLSHRLHALLLPYPALGHIRPMMQLAHCLARRNIAVTFVNTDHNHALIQEADETKKKAMESAGSLAEEHKGLSITLVAVPDGLDAKERRSALDIPRLTRAIDSMLPSIERLILDLRDAGRPVTCIIVDATTVDVTPIAQKLNIPRASFWCPSIALARMFYEHKRYESNGDITPEGHVVDMLKILIGVVGVPQLRGYELPWLYGSATDITFLYDTRVKALANIVSSSWFLCNSCIELEEEAITTFSSKVKVAPIGPLLGYDFQDGDDEFSCGDRGRDNKTSVGLWTEDNECLKWLDTRPKGSVIYLAFGSLALFNQQQVEELAMGIEASEQAFLWVLRVDLMASLPEGFAQRTRETGRVIAWAPQHRVLAHPALAIFVTHCGWNSCLEAICNGIPTVAWPYFADQFTNRALLVDMWKVGVNMVIPAGNHGAACSDHLVPRDVVAETLRSIMTSEQGHEMRKRAAQVQLRVRASVQKGGSSYCKLQEFISDMKHHASTLCL